MADTMAQFIPPLNVIVGLPASTAAEEIASASERQFQALLDQAACGDPDAKRDLVTLRLAYLNWAYPSEASRRLSASVHEARA
jgi:hypothetical protein